MLKSMICYQSSGRDMFLLVFVIRYCTLLLTDPNSKLFILFGRFVSWFSYHLSNFQYRWSWEDWEECLKFDHEHPRPKFIKEVLLKTLRYDFILINRSHQSCDLYVHILEPLNVLHLQFHNE